VSNYQNPHDEDIPRFEPWLRVMTAAFVPAIATLYLPGSFLVPLAALATILFGAGLFMLRRQSIHRASRRALEGAKS
jgi:MFS superfamily sulfate permease-like transporter